MGVKRRGGLKMAGGGIGDRGRRVFRDGAENARGRSWGWRRREAGQHSVPGQPQGVPAGARVAAQHRFDEGVGLGPVLVAGGDAGEIGGGHDHQQARRAGDIPAVVAVHHHLDGGLRALGAEPAAAVIAGRVVVAVDAELWRRRAGGRLSVKGVGLRWRRQDAVLEQPAVGAAVAIAFEKGVHLLASAGL